VDQWAEGLARRLAAAWDERLASGWAERWAQMLDWAREEEWEIL